MFTGIIEATGHIKAITPKSGDVRLRVQSAALDFTDVALGDSIATSGICLTVVDAGSDWYAADVSKETLGVTTLGDWKVGTLVNLEKAMLPSTRFGGHIVSGHVDAVGTILKKHSDARSVYVEVGLPKSLGKYIAQKGSLTVDGISLTTNDVKDSNDTVIACLNIVPHTAQVTSIAKNWTLGALVNIEVDVIARYLERLMLGQHRHQNDEKNAPKLNKQFLAEHGFLT